MMLFHAITMSNRLLGTTMDIKLFNQNDVVSTAIEKNKKAFANMGNGYQKGMIPQVTILLTLLMANIDTWR